MIDISFSTNTGKHVSAKMEVVPRIGEEVRIADLFYTVTNVIHVIPDRYASSSIQVIAEKIK